MLFVNWEQEESEMDLILPIFLLDGEGNIFSTQEAFKSTFV